MVISRVMGEKPKVSFLRLRHIWRGYWHSRYTNDLNRRPGVVAERLRELAQEITNADWYGIPEEWL
jgi:hypothetical protein